MGNLKIDRGHVLRREERLLKEAKMIFSCWMKWLSRWAVMIKRLSIESSPSYHERPIADEGPRYVDEDMLRFDLFI